MALTTQEKTQIAAIITREGGLSTFTTEVQALHATSAQTAALATLSAAITVTVSDWPTVQAYAAGASNELLYQVAGAIKAAAVARDASQLGPLFVALYGAVRAHLSV